MLLNSHPLKVNIDDGFLNLMSQDGASKDDVRVPEGELGVTITAAFEEGKDTLVTIVSAMGEEQVSFPRADWLECARLLAFRPFRSKRPPRVPSPHSLLLVGYFSSLRRLSLVHLHFTPIHLSSLRMLLCCACTFSWLDSACVLHRPLFRCCNEWLHELRS
jgi:hypothetical protein